MWFSVRHIIIKLLKIKEKKKFESSKIKEISHIQENSHKAIIKHLSRNLEMLYSEFGLSLSFTASLYSASFWVLFTLQTSFLHVSGKMAAFTSAQLSNYGDKVSLPCWGGGGRGELVAVAEHWLLLHFNQTLQAVLTHTKVWE